MGPDSPFIKNDRHALLVRVDGVKSTDYVLYSSIGMEYSWKKALADPWERRGLWLLGLVVVAFAVFVILQDFVL